MAEPFAPLPAPDRAPWPSHFATPEEILRWLNRLKPRDGLTAKCLLGMRWLVLEELERRVAEPEAKPTKGFTPDPPTLFTPQPHQA